MVLFVLAAAGAVWTFVLMADDDQGAAVAFLVFAFITARVATINARRGRWRGRA